MKPYALFFPGIALLCSLLLSGCQKKKDTGIAPTYKEVGGTGGNPYDGVSVTGSSPVANPATKSSQLTVGGTGWSNPSCASTFSTTLKGINGTIEVTLTFFSPPVSGSYNIAPAATSNQVCAMSVVNAPNQPMGITWYALSGVVVVNTSGNSVNASFSGIPCVQTNFNYPVVTLNGTLGCN